MKTKADPTGLARNRNKSFRRLKVRIDRAEKKIKALFRAIPKKRRTKVKIQNKETSTIYDYELTAQDLDQLNRSIDFIINDELLESQNEMPFDWYWKEDIEQPYRAGAIEETNTFNQLIVGAGIAGILIDGFMAQEIPTEQVLFSEIYRDNLAKKYASNFTTFKGLSENTTKQVMQTIELGTQSGLTPTKTAKNISNRFDVSRSSADRITRTEINKAFTDGKMETGIVISRRTGLRSAVIHISALTSTTRSHHAARHGNAYTVEDQMSWWSEGANRINCLCDITTVLIDKSGKVIDTKFQKEIKAERKFFD